MNKIKSGFISIVGRPNVGKSTLLNKIIGHKISIVTNKAQTTRNNIRGILTEKEYQLIFVDTPGIHTSKNQIDRFMNSSAMRSMKEVDVVVFMAPADETIGKNDLFILNELSKKNDIKKILVISKADVVSKEKLFLKATEWNTYEQIFDEIIITSSTENINIDKLIETIVGFLPETGHYFYDEESITDQPNRFAIREIIRESVLLKAGQEVPHSVAILVDELEETEDEINIVASIIVERKSQKGIIIGHQGKKISDIKYKSRKQIRELFEKDVNLELFVKVQENWRNSASLIKKMGYDKDKY
ncbi:MULTISPECIES: GTPase Era [Mesoplasma]|uniref:GTPase Era n=2 Tax=Mesoplasma florum TaxID=2151 RepID=Q6F1K0_MESFL|nr:MULTISPECIES: GTPase Era [Mesoplasma]AAT75623.1 GTP-binding protein, cell cycle control [Mesoplasma florum L1]AGY41341.1 GTP-binding protein Era [Mesoplasma florum W37]ATI73224.1 GTPase Era [Mesoplasma florum]AVN58876.1 GTPase Era [Mesoplasma florum]AVN59566.1 GTPase Era [Mesoplasma florum]